ncbi:hypothetical protein Calag_1213 [Caldisphaera lagunensis DSM 15908]|uniref:Uncharacterized protein n=1 Tax=Caldisphaera lagunensis (strain DSM 15908 / JCM 11604 / ANMR 0165 / IC-154) TaxID=1056495 RepID=L0ACQ9_CALLD|nr:hypothetical protein [Caldisphaera lagunensis]AFZ70932.1 hypothetical protein Calag_1213 [Caldisphaera lagunensis DSM 15908]
MKEIHMKIEPGNYRSVKLELSDAIELLNKVVSLRGIETKDINESFRILNNFDEFYEYQKKKFKDYVTPDKDVSDMIRGAVVVDNLKLIKENNKKYVVITFDRRLKEELIIKALNNMGYEVKIEK